MIETLLFGARFGLVAVFLLIQPVDVWTTIVALRLPWVVEVGDTEIGMPNMCGIAQRILGPRWWWLVKLPLLAFAPLLWLRLPALAEVPIIMLMIAANSYFFKIVSGNIANAKSTDPRKGASP